MNQHFHPRRVFACDDAKPRPIRDPTGTADLRRRFKSALAIRWRKFRNALTEAVWKNDMLDIRPDKMTALGLSMRAGKSDYELLEAYQQFVDRTLAELVLEGDGDFLDPMTERAYVRAVNRANRLLEMMGQPDGAQEAVFALQRQVVVELQGIMEAVSQKLVREASGALLDAVEPAKFMRASLDIIQKIGITRSNDMVNFYVVKAHGVGTLDSFEQAGIGRVSLVPETVKVASLNRAIRRFRDARRTGPGSRISRETTPSASTISRIRRAERGVERKFKRTLVEVQTAGDDLVCEECEGISADGPYTIDQARSLIPAHPNCRCTFVPEDEFDG